MSETNAAIFVVFAFNSHAHSRLVTQGYDDDDALAKRPPFVPFSAEKLTQIIITQTEWERERER